MGSPKPAKLRVGFILANNFTLTAFSTFIDTLRLAADEGDGSRPILCRWRVMSASGQPVRASCGVDVLPQSGLTDPSEFDYLVGHRRLAAPRAASRYRDDNLYS